MEKNEPSVCAVMLTRDRPELAAKAVECFRRQTYENKTLLIYENSQRAENSFSGGCNPDVWTNHYHDDGRTIGALRNAANACISPYWKNDIPPIIIHWDDDDWSHPNRITEQVALLQASGADVVGYNEMLFWREPRWATEAERRADPALFRNLTRDGEAWLYTSPVPKPTLGTSLCYWRKTWERKPFNPTLPNNRESLGEDTEFIRGLNVVAVSSVVKLKPGFKEHYAGLTEGAMTRTAPRDLDGEPRMIARIHGANSTRYNIEDARGTSWKRVPEWGARVLEILK